MKVLFDTSVLVAAIVQPHPMHSRALPWLKRAKAGDGEYVVASHTLAELYAVLTTLPVVPRISPGLAWRLIREDVERTVMVVALSAADYRITIRRVVELGLTGGVLYDALLVRVAQKARVQRLLTFNLEDFKRVWPEGEAVLCAP